MTDVDPRRMRIGQLADRLGVNPRTIRYYESVGVLPSPERDPSGYRSYGEDDVARFGFVRTAKRLGLSLEEICEVLALGHKGERPCGYVSELLDAEVADIDRSIEELRALRTELVSLRAKADERAAAPAVVCPIIEQAGEAGSGVRCRYPLPDNPAMGGEPR